MIPALIGLGYDPGDAADYTVAACWEFIIPGKGMEIANIGAMSYPLAVDRAFRAGAEACLGIARREKPDLIVLQSRSPSCGVTHRYDGTFSGVLTEGPGVTAQLLLENGFRVVDAESLEGGLPQ